MSAVLVQEIALAVSIGALAGSIAGYVYVRVVWRRVRRTLNAGASDYAIIHVSSRPGSDSWPVVGRVPGGWQSGAHHYPDADVLDVIPLLLRVS